MRVELMIEGQEDVSWPQWVALAQACDKTGACDEAFAHYRAGNELRKEYVRHRGTVFDPAQQRRLVDRLIATFTPAWFERVQSFGVESELPIFIVGMPRSQAQRRFPSGMTARWAGILAPSSRCKWAELVAFKVIEGPPRRLPALAGGAIVVSAVGRGTLMFLVRT